MKLIPTGIAAVDTKVLQGALDAAKGLGKGEKLTLELGSGKWKISEKLVIHSKTHLILQPDTVMVRMDEHKVLLRSANNKEKGGYTQSHDITIEGGVWDGAAKDKVKYSRFIEFGHAKNVTFKNATVKNFGGKHAMAFAGVNGIHVENVTFTGYIGLDLEPRKRCNAEILHIDGVSADGISEPGWKPFDDTPSRDVHVVGCTFDGGLCGVGSHYPKMPAKGDGFEVRDCTFRNIEFTAIDIFHFDGAKLAGNTFKKCGARYRFFGTVGTAEKKSFAAKEKSQLFCRAEIDQGELCKDPMTFFKSGQGDVFMA